MHPFRHSRESVNPANRSVPACPGTMIAVFPPETLAQ